VDRRSALPAPSLAVPWAYGRPIQSFFAHPGRRGFFISVNQSTVNFEIWHYTCQIASSTDFWDAPFLLAPESTRILRIKLFVWEHQVRAAVKYVFASGTCIRVS
jgi:hypothetical protein